MSAFARKLLAPSIKPDASFEHRYTLEALDKLEELFVTGRGQSNPHVRGTAWAAYNAATEFIDYYQRVGHGELGEHSDLRTERAWFGKGRNLKLQAWNLLHDYASIGVTAFQPYGPKTLLEVFSA